MLRVTAKRASFIAGVLGLGTGCIDATVPVSATLVVRNFRPDTITAVLSGPCEVSGTLTTNLLQTRDRLLPQAEHGWSRDPGCVDLVFKDLQDSVLDTRSNVVLQGGDSVIIVLRK